MSKVLSEFDIILSLFFCQPLMTFYSLNSSNLESIQRLISFYLFTQTALLSFIRSAVFQPFILRALLAYFWIQNISCSISKTMIYNELIVSIRSLWYLRINKEKGSKGSFLTILLFKAWHLIKLVFQLNLQQFIQEILQVFELLQSYLFHKEDPPNIVELVSNAPYPQSSPFG